MRICILLIFAALLFPVAAHGQSQETPRATVFAIYYRCVQGDAARADAIYKEHVVPFLKSEQAAGRITAYGYARHWSGSDWRRLEYVAGTDMDKLLDSRAASIKMTQSPEHSKAMDEFDRICSSHDDYVWRSVASSLTPTAIGRDRSPFAMSTYYVCGPEEREADFIVKTAFAPILNQRVKDGMIASWTWQEHLIGDKYRRILVLDGADEKALMKNWATLQDDLEKANADMTRRFSEICYSHSDYIWETVR